MIMSNGKEYVTVLKNIATIELKGANFREAQRLPLLSQNGIPVKASLIYGRNGSGKSTIANAFKVMKHRQFSQ